MCPDASPHTHISYFGNLFVLFESPSQPHSNCWYEIPLSWMLNSGSKYKWVGPWIGSYGHWLYGKSLPGKVSSLYRLPVATFLQVKVLNNFLLSALNLKVNLTLTWASERSQKYGWDQDNLMEKLSCCPIILLWQPTFLSYSNGSSWLCLSLSKRWI